ncbi:MAG: hypothetical protein HYV16_14240 [Gammaproteobacteria bacterium]|nr:hypothetical protein [Gammaproteobacteria bacterium]
MAYPKLLPQLSASLARHGAGLTRALPRPGLAMALSLILAAALAAGWQLARTHLAADQHEVRERYGRSLARQAAQAYAPILRDGKPEALAPLMDSLLRDGVVLQARVTDADGLGLVLRPPAPTSSGNAPPGLQFVESIQLDGMRLGFVQLLLDPEAMASSGRQTLLRLGLGAGLVLLLASALLFGLARAWRTRLLRLTKAVARLAAGEYAPEAITEAAEDGRDRRDELSMALDQAERLRQELAQRQQREREYARFAPSPLAASLRGEHGEWQAGRYAQASLLLVEFVNLGALSERLEPGTLAALINQYHALLARAAKLYNGQVDKYYGDGVLVLFGLPRSDEEHAFHALCATLLFQQLVNRYNETRPAEQVLQVRLCLHTGKLLTAILGGEQAQFAVLGDALNLVMRLSAVAGPDEVVMSRELAELPELKGRVGCQAHRNVLIKGRSEPCPSYRLDGLAAPYDELLAGQVQHLWQQLQGA